jgi:hypothetical protein
MTDVVARREFDFVGPRGPTKVVAWLGKPAPMPDAPHGDWYCPFRIDGPDRVHELFGGGVDSLQALLMGISGMRIYLRSIGHAGKLTFLEDENLHLELTGNAV